MASEQVSLRDETKKKLKAFRDKWNDNHTEKFRLNSYSEVIEKLLDDYPLEDLTL